MTLIAASVALRRLICRLLIGLLTSTQLSIAAYACPVLSGTTEPTMSAMKDVGASIDADQVMPAVTDMSSTASHPGMEMTFSNLCAGHCQFGKQNSDHAPAPAVSPAPLVSLYPLASYDPTGEGVAATATSPVNGRPVSADPPHAILHCCFRD